MSNVAKVITTTTSTAVESANAAVSLGRWSNLAIIASSFRTAFSFTCLITGLGWLHPNHTSFFPESKTRSRLVAVSRRWLRPLSSSCP
jgi:hypothetical protein